MTFIPPCITYRYIPASLDHQRYGHPASAAVKDTLILLDAALPTRVAASCEGN